MKVSRVTGYLLYGMILAAGALLFVGINALAQPPIPGPQEITITTYYPAPYGVYNELTTRSDTYLATDSGNVGIGTTSPGAKLHIGGTAGTDGVMFPDGTLQTTAAHSRVAQAVGTTDISAPAVEADMPDMSVTLNTGTKILVMFSAPFWAAVLNSGARLYLYVDGIEIRETGVAVFAGVDVVSFQHLVDGLTPGSHTIKIRWEEGFYGWIGDISQQGSTAGARVLTVVGLD